MFLLTAFGLLLNLTFFFFNDTATTEIYTLSLHDALPISAAGCSHPGGDFSGPCPTAKGMLQEAEQHIAKGETDRKSTRLNSSHSQISYAVFCLKKKKILTAPVRLYPTNASTPRQIQSSRR